MNIYVPLIYHYIGIQCDKTLFYCCKARAYEYGNWSERKEKKKKPDEQF